MFRWDRLILIVSFFVIGWIACAGYIQYSEQSKEQPYSEVSGLEISSPGDWIAKEQIIQEENKIIVELSNATIAQFTDTNSMDPLIDIYANSIEISPVKDQLKVGDIISYQSDSKTIIHRIVLISEDENGTFYITKGDNNNLPDKYKVRFEQIKGFVVGILY
jgi:hypothetical protein